MQKSNQDPAQDSKKIFLLLFARELIRNSEEGLLQLKRILEKEGRKNIIAEMPLQKAEAGAKEEQPLIKSILSEAPRITVDGEFAAVKPVHIEPSRREISGYGVSQYPILRIPEPKLPEEFMYLKPVASMREIDLDKLNPLIYDAAVKKIECDGPGKQVIVTGSMGRKPTEIVLSGSEIEDIIDRFSRAARIPADVGVFRVVVGNLIFSAIISDVVPSRFTITKIGSAQMNIRPIPQPVPPAVKMSYADYIKRM